jgi:anti-sigma factor RsiW
MAGRTVETRLECTEVRGLLAEQALGVLAPDTSRAVAEHLAWCAGCRKEAAELAEGAAWLAVSASAEPPAELEDRVVGAVAAGAGGRRRRGSRLAVAIAAAVALASAGLAGALAGRVQRLEDAAALARVSADRAARRFQEVLEDVGGATPVLSAPLRPAGGDAGGRALLFDANEGRDFALVVVGGLPRSGEPYLAYLVSPSGRRLVVGRLEPAGADQFSRYRFFRDLAGARDLVVVDRAGRTVLTAAFPPA